ncbi:sensor histidine kinase [Chryseobacterium sp. MP_3.2]|uniref:sensor histidine kinase n=1 Tax=Chryseobacterium sp. MP_3.2 TaxID=3071712 RepID=UPI002E09E887|nr:signal transduction histidine kinase [Chryseobacterium sp. MP_3.2]
MKKIAKILRENNAEIMKRWEDKVLQEVPASREANSVALYDHLPNLINDIADIMSRYPELQNIHEDEKFKEIFKNSENHGRHRSTSPNYSVEQIVHEYIIFHHTLSEFIKSQNSFVIEVLDLLKYAIENSILKSVGAFSYSIQVMQEKLIATLAHDIRNPLFAAQLSLKMIQELQGNECSAKMLETAHRSVLNALRLTENLMDGISVKAGEGMMLHFENVDILQDIKWVFTESKEVYASEIFLKCQEDHIKGVFDNIAIRRLLENLISNAVKHGSPQRPITISVKDSEDAIEIVIQNYGEPISAEKRAHIFKFLGKDNNGSCQVRKGWGMGLTLAQMVAEAHGGNIKLENTEENGTSFIVTLFKHFNQSGKRRTKLIVEHQLK